MTSPRDSFPLKTSDSGSLAELFSQNQQRLKRAVELRIPRLKGRVDSSDVVQEAFLEATARYPEFQRQASLPAFLWLRFLTIQRVALIQRQNLRVKARDGRRELQQCEPDSLSASTASLASLLVGRRTSPSQAASREEMRQRVQQSFDEMDPVDREVLVLRHFEQISNQETAQVLDLSETAASKRYVRALKRMKDLLILDDH
jgi:RNA polymerase sigma-70 factor (ECF subfamily)